MSESKRCKMLETTPELKWIKTWCKSICIKLQQPTNAHNRCACMQKTIFMQLAPRWVANIFMEKLPAPNLTSTAGSKLPSTRIPNRNPHLRSVMSDSFPSRDTSYVMRGSHITICGVDAAVRNDDVS